MNSEWISVEERLPEVNKNVLVFFPGIEGNKPHIYVSFLLPRKEFVLETVHGPVTHWMPLPEPPEVKA